jgi:hypothetical protein
LMNFESGPSISCVMLSLAAGVLTSLMASISNVHRENP